MCVVGVRVLKYFIFSSNKTMNVGEIAGGVLCFIS